MTGPSRPNILLMHCHDLGRFLGCHGVSTVRTPNLDALAAGGVRFDRAFATAPHCSPSRAALFTGRYPHATGVMGLTHRNFGWDLHAGERHLASLLGAAGYDTELQGVHHESRIGPDQQIAARLGFDRVRSGGRGDEVADRTIATLRRHAGATERPFYLQVGFFEPHRVGPPVDGGRRMGFVGDYMTPDDELGLTIPPYLSDDSSTRAEIAELQGAVAYMDAAAGRVLAALDELGLRETTVVVFTTDHGLALPRAKCTLYDPGIEIALIMRAPSLGWTSGRVVDALVSNVDVVPTLLEAAGVPVPDTVHGRSLTPLMASGGTAGGSDHVFAEFTYHDYFDPRRCVRTDRHKLIVNFDIAPALMIGVSQSWRPWSTPAAITTGQAGPQEETLELYDLRSDPHETTNLAADPGHAEVVERLRHQLVAWMRRTGDPLLNGPVPSPAYQRARRFIEQDTEHAK